MGACLHMLLSCWIAPDFVVYLLRAWQSWFQSDLSGLTALGENNRGRPRPKRTLPLEILYTIGISVPIFWWGYVSSGSWNRCNRQANDRYIYRSWLGVVLYIGICSTFHATNALSIRDELYCNCTRPFYIQCVCTCNYHRVYNCLGICIELLYSLRYAWFWTLNGDCQVGAAK